MFLRWGPRNKFLPRALPQPAAGAAHKTRFCAENGGFPGKVLKSAAPGVCGHNFPNSGPTMSLILDPRIGLAISGTFLLFNSGTQYWVRVAFSRNSAGIPPRRPPASKTPADDPTPEGGGGRRVQYWVPELQPILGSSIGEANSGIPEEGAQKSPRAARAGIFLF